MGTLRRMASKCRKCPYRSRCNNKRFEAEAYMEPLQIESSASLIQPMAVKHDYRDIKIAENTTITIDLEELKKQLERDFYRKLDIGINYGG